MKTLILALLIPCHLFCCQECIETLQDKIDATSIEIMHMVYSGKEFEDECEFFYLIGKYEAYWDCLLMLQHEHS
jgi:hypothetical protein